MFATQGKALYGDTKRVSRVYLGSRMEPEDRERITTKIKPLRISTSEMSIDKYAIIFAAKDDSRP